MVADTVAAGAEGIAKAFVDSGGKASTLGSSAKLYIGGNYIASKGAPRIPGAEMKILKGQSHGFFAGAGRNQSSHSRLDRRQV